MTLKEKVGQLNMPCVYQDELGTTIPAKQEACKRYTEGTHTDEIGPGGGFFRSHSYRPCSSLDGI